MALTNHLDRATGRVADEQDVIADERRAYERFRTTVETTATDAHSTTSAASTGAGAAAVGLQRRSRPDRGCSEIRAAFAETVRPYSTDDIDREESVIETLGAELGDSIAAALSPETTHEFTPQLKTAILAAVDDRHAELAVMERALTREAESLQTAVEAYDDITDRLLERNETSLFEFGFSELRQRHEALAADRETCERLLERRQELLASTTSRGGDAGINHRTLVRYLYQSQPATYPALSTLVQLDSTLADCQRTLRDHLTRRV